MNHMIGIFAKIGLVLLGTFGGMISGAVIIYFLSALIYLYAGHTKKWIA